MRRALLTSATMMCCLSCSSFGRCGAARDVRAEQCTAGKEADWYQEAVESALELLGAAPEVAQQSLVYALQSAAGERMTCMRKSKRGENTGQRDGHADSEGRRNTGNCPQGGRIGVWGGGGMECGGRWLAAGKSALTYSCACPKSFKSGRDSAKTRGIRNDEVNVIKTSAGAGDSTPAGGGRMVAGSLNAEGCSEPASSAAEA